MAELPPPSGPPQPSDAAAAERAVRLERLAATRTPTDASATGDRTSRLERLARRSHDTAEPASSGAKPSRRHHPARGARAAALGMSLATTAGLAGVFATLSRTSAAETAAVVVTNGTGAAATSQQATVVDGAVFRNKWGPVQVEATFGTDGTLTDVVALQTPDDRGRSVSINNYAVPRLTSDALTSQSATVDTVSGATYTSVGYRQSLQSAIDAARSAGVTSIA